MIELLKRSFLFFTHEEIMFSFDPPQIIIGPPAEKRILDESNFYDFQKIIRHMYFIEVEVDDIIINPDDNPAVVALKMKARKNRENLRKAKAKKAQKEGMDLKLSDLIGSLTINNCGLSIDNIWNITYYAFHD